MIVKEAALRKEKHVAEQWLVDFLKKTKHTQIIWSE